MPDRIFIPSDESSSDVVKLGDGCYERVGPSDQAPTVSSVDEEFDSCDECEGNSSSASYSSEPCSDCGNDIEQPPVTISFTHGQCYSPLYGIGGIPVNATPPQGETCDFGGVDCHWHWYGPECDGSQQQQQQFYGYAVDVYYHDNTDTWDVRVHSNTPHNGEAHVYWSADDLPLDTIRCNADTGYLSGVVVVPLGQYGTTCADTSPVTVVLGG